MTTTGEDKLTDPYGALEYAIGSGDDFWCFDYAIDTERKLVRLHAVINSETGSFIQDAEPPTWVSYDDAVTEALRLVYAAADWCADGGPRHSVKGWRQDIEYFARVVQQTVQLAQGAKYRKVPRTSKYRIVDGQWDVRVGSK